MSWVSSESVRCCGGLPDNEEVSLTLPSVKRTLWLGAALFVSYVSPSVVLAQSAEEAVGTAVGLTVCIGAPLAWLAIGVAGLVWVVKDAQARGSSAGAWVVILLVFGPIGLLAYLVARPKGKLVPCPECGRQKPIVDAICPHCGKRVV